MTTPRCRTDRLDLEPVGPGHAEEMSVVLADRALFTYYADEASPTVDELRVRYARQAVGVSPDGRETWHSWIVRERASGAAVGFAQATITRQAGTSTGASAELAWVIGVPWQGRGYATEAASAVRDAVTGPASSSGDDVAQVHAHIAPGHVASESVARHLGLVATPVVHEGETRWESVAPAT